MKKETEAKCQCDLCTGKLDKMLKPKERYALGKDLIKIVRKYTGMTRGTVQAVNIHSEINEPANITVDILL